MIKIGKQNSPHFHRAFRHRDLLALRGGRLLHERRDHRRGLEFFFQRTLIVEELLTPAEVIFQHVVKFGARRDAHHALVEFVGRAESFGVPRRDFAKPAAAVLLAFPLFSISCAVRIIGSL